MTLIPDIQGYIESFLIPESELVEQYREETPAPLSRQYKCLSWIQAKHALT